MAKSHFSIKKRNKELARKLKQEQKRQRKLEKNSINPEEASDETQVPTPNGENELISSEFLKR
jgi:hypothetical protein